VTVATFLEAGGQPLQMKLVSGGRGLRRRITEAALNRAGLALSGFFKYFAHRRIQVIGLAEYSYLSSLPAAERERRLRDFFGQGIPCVVLSRGKKPFPEMLRLAEEFRVPVLKTHQVTKNFVNAATIVMENLTAPRMNVQGTMVEIMGMGVLLEGRAGIGKSETALGLIKRGHALVSDDVTAVRVDSAGAVIGAPVPVTRYHMEIRGLGIIHVPSLFGVASVREEKKLDLVATLFDPGARNDAERGAGERRTREFFGVKVPQVMIEVKPGRDIVNVIEAAALDQKLRRLGHDAAKELDEKLVDLLMQGKVASE
jgi:HPr kinase/phosphorylase